MEAVGRIQEERMTVVLEVEVRVGRSFVCFEGMKFDLAEERPEDTCWGYMLLALVGLFSEVLSETRRIGLFLTMIDLGRMIHSEMHRQDEWTEVVAFGEAK